MLCNTIQGKKTPADIVQKSSRTAKGKCSCGRPLKSRLGKQLHRVNADDVLPFPPPETRTIETQTDDTDVVSVSGEQNSAETADRHTARDVTSINKVCPAVNSSTSPRSKCPTESISTSSVPTEKHNRSKKTTLNRQRFAQRQTSRSNLIQAQVEAYMTVRAVACELKATRMDQLRSAYGVKPDVARSISQRFGTGRHRAGIRLQPLPTVSH